MNYLKGPIVLSRVLMFHLKEEVIVISRWDLSLFLSNCGGGGGGGVGNLIKFSAAANYVLSGGPAPLHPSTHLSSRRREF
jgi:hypothetical protein